MDEENWKVRGRRVGTVPVGCVFRGGPLGGQDGLWAEGEQCEESGERGAVEMEPGAEEVDVREQVDKAHALGQISFMIMETVAKSPAHTIYQAKLRCSMSIGSSVRRRLSALPLPGSNFLPTKVSYAATYSSNSSSSSPASPPRLKNAHCINSFTLSCFISSCGAPRNHRSR